MRICAITPHQLLNAPRVVKEADALARAGHDVRVISVRKLQEQAALEQSAVTGRWRLQTIDIDRRSAPARWLLTGVRQRLAREVRHVFPSSAWLAGMAASRAFVEIVRAVVGEPTDL